MRHLLVRLASAAFVAGLVFGLNPASAALLPKLDGLVSQTNAVEDVGYRYHRGWRLYRYGYWGYRRPTTATDITTATTTGRITGLTGVIGGSNQPLNPSVGGNTAGPRFRSKNRHKRVTTRLPDMAECARDSTDRVQFDPRARACAPRPLASRRTIGFA